MKYLLFLTLFVCAGCVGAETAINRDQPFVSVGNGGSLHGSNSITIFADEKALSVSFDPSAAETKQTIIGLPEGTYAKVQITALEQIMGFDQPKPGPSCLDYGNDYITVFEGPGIQETLGVDCPDNDMRAAQNAVLQIYYNAIKEPSE